MKKNNTFIARFFVGMSLVLFLASCTTNDRVIIETDYGDMVVELRDDTPLHKENFLKLVDEGFYDDLLFHRIIPGFMIQGGDPDSRNAAEGQMLGQGGPGYTIPAEFTGGLHIKGALSAARIGGPQNPDKESSGSQFYIVQGNPIDATNIDKHINRNPRKKYSEEDKEAYLEAGAGAPFLDEDYTVFGQVIEGLDVIDEIAAVKTGQADRPVEDVVMKIRKE